MNTFELNNEAKANLEKIHSIGGRLRDNYDPEVVAGVVGVKISTITCDLIKGNNDRAYLEDLKGLAEDLMASYDDEVLAYALGQEVISLLKDI